MLNYRAIARGFLVDLSTTCLFAASLSLVLLDPGSSSTPLIERVYGSPALDWTCLLAGLFMTMLGAFVAGRMVPGREITHATAVGCLSLLASLFTCGSCPFVDWFTFSGLILTVPVAQLGGAAAGLYTALHGSHPD